MVRNSLGIFARVPVVGEVKTRLLPVMTAGEACDLYRAFLGDTLERVQQLKASPTVFYGGTPPDDIAAMLPKPWPLVPQAEGDLGERMQAAFDHLLSRPESRAVLIGSDSPDLPLIHIRHAFQRLKHKDVVIGPSLDGGYYLMGLRAPAPELFQGIAWGEPGVLASTLDAISRAGLSLSLLPPWYDVDDAQSLELLRALCAGRRLAGGVRLPRTEKIILD